MRYEYSKCKRDFIGCLFILLNCELVADMK